MMTFDILTLFPEMFEGIINSSIIKRAIESGPPDTPITILSPFSIKLYFFIVFIKKMKMQIINYFFCFYHFTHFSPSLIINTYIINVISMNFLAYLLLLSF